MPERALRSTPTATVTMSPISRLLCAACLVLGLVAWCRVGPSYWRMMKPPPGANTDFFQDWASARNFREGRPVYSPHEQTMPIYLGREPRGGEKQIEYNAHPPTSVLLAIPFTGLDLSNAVLAWNLVTAAAMLAALGIVAASLPELRALFLPVALILPLCLPVYGNFQQGQLTLILVLLMTAAWALDRSDRPAAAGAMIGAAAAVKLFPAYLLVYFAARGRWRGLAGASATIAALTLATVAVLGWEAYWDYAMVVLPSLGKFRSGAFNLSFDGLWHKLFDPASERGWVQPLWYSPAAARGGLLLSDALATAIVAIVARRAHTREQGDLAFATAATAMLLASPITWDYSLPLLMVPLAVAIRAAMDSPRLAILLVPILAYFIMPLSIILPMILDRQPTRVASPTLAMGVMSMGSYALLALFAALAVRAAGVVKADRLRLE